MWPWKKEKKEETMWSWNLAVGEKKTLAAACMKGAAAAAAAAAEAETEIYLRGLLLPPLFYFGGGFGENGRSKNCQFLYYLQKNELKFFDILP